MDKCQGCIFWGWGSWPPEVTEGVIKKKKERERKREKRGKEREREKGKEDKKEKRYIDKKVNQHEKRGAMSASRG